MASPMSSPSTPDARRAKLGLSPLGTSPRSSKSGEGWVDVEVEGSSKSPTPSPRGGGGLVPSQNAQRSIPQQPHVAPTKSPAPKTSPPSSPKASKPVTKPKAASP